MKELTPIIAQWRSELREAEQRLDALETARNQMDQARRLMQESIGLLDAVRSDAENGMLQTPDVIIYENTVRKRRDDGSVITVDISRPQCDPESEPTPPTQADPVASTDAETIENALTTLGMTRSQLATAMGVSPSSIRNYLQGKNGIGEAPRAALDKLLAEHSKPSEFPRMIALERVRCARRHVERFESFDKLSDERWQVEGGERVKLSAEALKRNTVVEVERVKDEQREARARKRRKSMNSF